MSQRYRIALDAFGSDGSPAVEVQGAIHFVRTRGQHVVLVGDRERLARELASRGLSLVDDSVPSLELSIIHASGTITMNDAPSRAVRSKQDSSMHRAFELLRDGAADAVVTAGNSGAALAVAAVRLGRLPGVERPALAGVFPRAGGATVLVDLGANVECKPSHLAEFATMGGVYAHTALGVPAPRVGLLSNGSEEEKGTEITRAAHVLLENAIPPPLQYIGYIEGEDLWNGRADVAVTDGFTGNVLLKTVEGLALNLFGRLRDELSRSRLATLGWLLARGAVRRVLKKTDYAEVGGATLLGVNGVVIIAHGRSNSVAIHNALKLAKETAAAQSTKRLSETLGLHQAGKAEVEP